MGIFMKMIYSDGKLEKTAKPISNPKHKGVHYLIIGLNDEIPDGYRNSVEAPKVVAFVSKKKVSKKVK